jgi:hypothetical protein
MLHTTKTITSRHCNNEYAKLNFEFRRVGSTSYAMWVAKFPNNTGKRKCLYPTSTSIFLLQL